MVFLRKLKNRHLTASMVVLWLFYQCFGVCLSLNDEGLALLKFRERVVNDPFGALSNWKDEVGVADPCSWFGVGCSEGNVVFLNLKDLCLEGTLSPDLGSLVHIKSIILCNNSFYGVIPDEIVKLKELEVLDLRHNDFQEPLPDELVHSLSLATLLFDNHKLFGSIPPEIHDLRTLSKVEEDNSQLVKTVERSFNTRRNIAQIRVGAKRRLLQATPMNPPRRWFHTTPEMRLPFERSKPFPSPSPSPSPSLSPSPSSSPSHSPVFKTLSLPPSPKVSVSSVPSPPTVTVFRPSAATTVPTTGTQPMSRQSSLSKHHRALILSMAICGSGLFLVVIFYIFICRSNRVASVRPWATGLSGQLQKAFVTGVPKLGRSEIETACEDFSNVIGSTTIGSVYKGTLSSGVEIAVASLAVTSAKEWSRNLETHFRNKIETLSKINNKNFVNLLGFCEEEEPFTRMMVFEYAPNGTLFEHLHIKESEHLNWGMRIRIAMGMAYCLEYMHQLRPPIFLTNLNSSAVRLTEDYAAKISDFGLSVELGTARIELNPENDVYSFGVILFEMMTGRMPYLVDNGSLEDWASDYLRGEQPLKEMADPTLTSIDMEQLENIISLIKSCVHPDPRQRPDMKQVTRRLREITEITPDGAIPKLSPLWWAELEILSTEAT